MILNPFWEWQPVQFFKELFRRCHKFCFQNHPRGSFRKLYTSRQVSICSITPNYTSKIEHWDGWLVVLRLNVPVNNFSVMSGRSYRFLGN